MDLIIVKNANLFQLQALLTGSFQMGEPPMLGGLVVETPVRESLNEVKANLAPSDAEPPRQTEEKSKRAKKTKPEPEVVEPTKDEPVDVTAEMLRNACKTVSIKHGRDAVLAIFNKHAPGKDKIDAIDPALWGLIFNDLQEAANAA